MGDIRQVSASSTYGARGVAGTSFLGRTGQNKPEFGLWHAVLRTIAVFLALRAVSMSVKPVEKMVVVLFTYVGRQRAHPLVPNLNLKKAVFYNWPPLWVRLLKKSKPAGPRPSNGRQVRSGLFAD